MDYNQAVGAIVEHALETMDDCADVVLPKPGSAEEGTLIAGLTFLITRVFPKVTR